MGIRNRCLDAVSIHAPRFREAMPFLLIGVLDFRLKCFNPRPPFPGGDALQQGANWEALVVSIHAPRFREAMPATLVPQQGHLAVSIHAPRFREAMRMLAGA